MKRLESQSNRLPAKSTNLERASQHVATAYQKVQDERKRPIRGLWKRNDRFYAQMTLENEATGIKQVRRVPLEGVRTPAQARQKMEDLAVARRKGKLPVLRLTPKFTDFAEGYLLHFQTVKDAKRESTLETEGYAIERWKEHLGETRLDKITRTMVDRFMAKRQAQGMAARTVNLEITILRNVLNKAIDDRWLTCLPTENVRPLKSSSPKRQLAAPNEIEKICSVSFKPIFFQSRLAKPIEKGQPLQNAQQFSDYIRFLCYSGARMSEAMRVAWIEVDFDKGQLTVGADGKAKNWQWRVVDFNPALAKLLAEMHDRRAPDSKWLFPSPRRGEADRPAKSFRESLILAREAAGLNHFGFHDCRHYFISMAIMSGIDYMTIARWVGHQDGGILIGRVYGHLSNEHAKIQASKLNI